MWYHRLSFGNEALPRQRFPMDPHMWLMTTELAIHLKNSPEQTLVSGPRQKYSGFQGGNINGASTVEIYQLIKLHRLHGADSKQPIISP